MNNLINKAKELGWSLEIKEIDTKDLMIRVLNDEVKQYESSLIKRYVIKTIVNGKTIIINTEDIGDSDKIFETINNNLKLIDNDDKDMLSENSIIDREKLVDDLDVDEIRNDMLSLYNYKKDYPNILNIDVIFESSIKNTRIINTNDIELIQNSNYKSMYISVTVKENNQVSEVSDYYLFNNYSFDELNNIFMNVLKDAINRLHEESIESSKYNVIINNNAMNDILNVFKDAFFAKNISQGVSVLSDKFNKEVFSSKITIVEEPLNNDLTGTYKVLFDSEGIHCINKTIVENGKFINKLYDIRESIKDGVKSTGNSDGVNNMYIVPGNVSFDELVKELNDGVLITDLKGLHSGVNTVTGDMSLEAKGYLVDSGKMTIPLNSILLSANIFEILNNVINISNDLKFGSPSVGSPSLLLNNIMIVGEK